MKVQRGSTKRAKERKQLLKRWLEDLSLPSINVEDDSQKQIALLVIAYMHSLDIIKLLIPYGANFNHKDRPGRTILMYALIYQREKENIRALVEATPFSSINVEEGSQKQTALLLTITSRYSLTIIKMLIQYSANAIYQDGTGRTMLMYGPDIPKRESNY